MKKLSRTLVIMYILIIGSGVAFGLIRSTYFIF